ncbi:MAG: glycosyltransferase family 9 protein [Alphaproteobacteria bacterium]
MKMPRTILVYVHEDLLGDGILKLPFARALREMFPQAHITWWAGGGKSFYAGGLKPLVRGLIDHVMEQHLESRMKELVRPSPLKHKFFDLIIDTQRDLFPTLALKKIPHGVFVSRTAGFLFSAFKPTSKMKPQDGHLSSQLIFLLEIIKKERIKKPDLLPDSGVVKPYEKPFQKYFKANESYVGFAPGAGNRKKCWPLENFIEVAHFVVKQGKKPVFILGPAETDWHGRLKEEFPQALFPLQDLPDVMKDPLYTAALGFFLKGALVNDSGIAHLLILSGVRLVSLFGNTKVEKVRPLSPHLTVVKASDFKGERVSDIPPEAITQILKNI